MSVTYGKMCDLRTDFREMFEKGLFADARLICYERKNKSGDGNESEERGKWVKIPVHKAIMMTRSKFFAEHFADGKDELEIPDIPANVVKIGINYLYTDEILSKLEENDLIALYKCSELYDLGIFETDNIKLGLVIKPMPTADEFPKMIDVRHQITNENRKRRKSLTGKLEYASTFSGLPREACAKRWWAKMRVGQREESPQTSPFENHQQPPEKQCKTTASASAQGQGRFFARGDEGKKKKKMHLDFALECNNGHGHLILVTDLSLSILNSADLQQKLKTTTREGFFVPKYENPCDGDLFFRLCEHVYRYRTTWEDCFNYEEVACEENGLLLLPQRQLFLLCEATVIVGKKKKRDSDSDFEKDEEEKSSGYHSVLMELLETGRFSNARIVCYEETPNGKGEGAGWEKVVFPVHKCVLGARSKFFSAAFSSGMREAESGELEVPTETGFSPATIRTLLQFIYTAAVPSSEKENGQKLDEQALISVFKAAHFYELLELVDHCSKLLGTTVENCAELLSLAHTYANETIMKKALKFLRKNKTPVKESSGWRRLMDEKSADEGEEDKNSAALKTLCGHWLMELPLTLENCCEVLQIAHCYGNWKVQKAAIAFLLCNEKTVRGTDGWRKLVSGEERSEGSEDNGRWLKRLIHAEKRSRRKERGLRRIRRRYRDASEDDNDDSDDDEEESNDEECHHSGGSSADEDDDSSDVVRFSGSFQSDDGF